MKQGDFWSGLALAVLGGGIVFAASGWDYLTPEGPGAGFFPLWYGIAMLIVALLLAAQSLRGGTAHTSQAFSAGQRRALAVIVALAITVASLKPIGFTVAFGLLTLFLVRYLYQRTWGVAAGSAVALSAGFYLVFVFALGVELPAGPLGF